jgi:hypothetical protein
MSGSGSAIQCWVQSSPTQTQTHTHIVEMATGLLRNSWISNSSWTLAIFMCLDWRVFVSTKMTQVAKKHVHASFGMYSNYWYNVHRQQINTDYILYSHCNSTYKKMIVLGLWNQRATLVGSEPLVPGTCVSQGSVCSNSVLKHQSSSL